MFKKINNYLNSISFLVPAAFIYILNNFFLVVLVALYSGQLFIEIIKSLQLFSLLFIVLYLCQKLNKYLTYFILNILFFCYLVLVGYFAFTKTNLDFSFLKRSAGDIDNILPQISYYLLIISIASLFNSLFIYKLKNYWDKKFKLLTLFIFIPFLFSTFLLSENNKFNNELIVFAKTIYRKNEIIDYYQNFYKNILETSTAENESVKKQAGSIDKKNLPSYLDNIIFLQIESLNGFLVNQNYTPNFIKLADEGIFFPKFYSNSVQTILAQETMLCSLPNSFDINLSMAPDNKKIICLPEILKEIGYKTLFYKSYDLEFSNTGRFMRTLKFDEAHANDIMKPGDTAYPWGYKEDIFFQRTFEHLKLNKLPKNNFIYIEIGPTNHWPFITPEGLESQVPFPKPRNHQERLINTTFLQDSYLNIAWKEINRLFPDKNYTLLVLGDHSWPAEIHSGNNFNEKLAYEENFTTSLVMVIGNEYKGKIINNRYSQMDILPSLTDLFGLELSQDDWCKSFIPEIKGEISQISKVMQIQPYSDRYINIIDGMKKYQYNGEADRIMLCDLKRDPDEKNCQPLSGDKKNNLEIIKSLLPVENK